MEKVYDPLVYSTPLESMSLYIMIFETDSVRNDLLKPLPKFSRPLCSST